MKILENEILAKRTTMKVGGKAKYFYVPETINEFVGAFVETKKRFGENFILGGGSNLIFPDDDFQKPVISTTSLKNIKLSENTIECEAGCSWTQVCNLALENGMENVEDFNGLPGTVGGAVFMNARCFSTQVSDVLESVEYFDEETGKICTYKINQKDWDYKKSPFQTSFPKRKIVLSAKIRLQKSSLSKEELKEKYQKAVNERKQKRHYEAPSAGSVFKNNHDFGKPSGQIIDECGLKGLESGGAQVAPWHGNFIINKGNASATDIKNLVEKVKKEVFEKKGFCLEEEIIFVE